MAHQANPYAELETVLGYQFKDVQLLETSLTHSSYRFESQEKGGDNQRLEFLGDAVLGLLLSDIVFRQYAEYPEGTLTILRSRVVSEVGLAPVARAINLGHYIRLGHGAGASGARNRDSMLGDTLEALFGALYLDAGLEKTGEIFKRLFEPSLSSLSDDAWEDNPKGQLQQVAQHVYRCSPVYSTLSEKGPSHARTFRVEVSVKGFKAHGEGNSKQSAQIAAARELLRIVV